MSDDKGLIKIGNYRLAYTCMGTGTPAVVLEAGAGTSRGAWSKIMPAIAEFSQVLSYDRAGLGESDPAPRGRNCHDLANDLAQLLHNLRIPPSYILVGNSLGGHIIRYFSYLNPGTVTGMILLDSMHPDQNRQALTLMPPPTPADSADLSALRASLTNLMNGMINLPDQDPEGLDYYTIDEQVRKTGPLRNMPLVVVTAGSQAQPDLPFDYLQAYHKMFLEYQADLTRLSTHGRQVYVDWSGHFIQEDEPDLVIDTVRQMVDIARQATPGI